MGKIDPIVGGGAGGSEVSDQRLGARPGIWPWRLQPICLSWSISA
jgi:hypothetical protein